MSKPFNFVIDAATMEGGSGLFGHSEVQPTRLNGIRLNEAVLGTTIPILIGQHRISWKLLWYGDFTSRKASTQSSGGGGSGMGKGGTQYVYSASVIGSVCHGPCQNFLGVWSSMGGGKFAVVSTSESGTVPASGGTGGDPAYTPTQASIYASDIGTAFQEGYSVPVNDYGSPGSTTLTGTQNRVLSRLAWPGGAHPSAPLVSGQYTVDPVTNLYYFAYADIGSAFTVNYIYYQFYILDNELATVPLTGPYQVTVTYQTQFHNDNGVSYYPSGVALRSVGGTPSVAGTYNPNGGNYLFAAADSGQGIEIFYTYQDTNTDTNAPSTMNLTFFDGAQGQSPWSYLTSKHPNFALGYSQIAYVASSGMYLGYSAALPQLNFEILGIASFGGGIPDANPADAIIQLLINPVFGIGFPEQYIDVSLGGTAALSFPLSAAANAVGGSTIYHGTFDLPTNQLSNVYVTVSGFSTAANNGEFLCTGNTSTTITLMNTSGVAETNAGTATSANNSSVFNYWGANNFFLSALLDSQVPCMSVFGDWLEAGQAYITWDAQLLKFIPLGDTSAVANKLIYTPPTQPVVDLDDNDYHLKSADDPIKITSQPWQSRWNRVGVRWSVRLNDYNEDVVQVQDDARIQVYGLMVETPKDYQFITTLNAANFAANMRLQRLGAIYTKYEFTLKSNFAFLSPGDIITITDGLLGSNGYLFGRTPVRITKMTDSPTDGIKIEAETFPWSVGNAYLYNAQAVLPSNTAPGPQADPGDTTALLIEVPNEAQNWDGNNVFGFCNGAQVNWGGCEVFVSLDGTTYNPITNVDTPARLGMLTADFPTYAGTNPDNTNTLSVNMQQSGAILNTVGSAQAAMYATQSAVVSNGTSWSPLLLSDNGFNLGASTTTGGGTEGPLTVTAGSFSTYRTYTPTWTNAQDITGSAGYATATVALTATVFNVTNVSVTSNVATITCTQSFLVGDQVFFNLVNGSNTWLNSGSYYVVTRNATSFTVGVSQVNYSASDTGSCNIQRQQFSQILTGDYIGGGAFSLPLSGVGNIIGITVTCKSYVSSYSPNSAGNAPSLTAQLVIGSTPIGAPKTVWSGHGGGSPTFPTSPTTLTLGGPADTWSSFLTVSQANLTVFGVQFIGEMSGTDSINPSATIDIQDVTITIAYAGGSSGNPWINPSNVTSASSYATSTLTTAENTLWLVAEMPSFNLPFGFILEGIQVEFEALSSDSGTPSITTQMYYNGQRLGTQKVQALSISNTSYTQGSATDTWGVSISNTLVDSFTPVHLNSGLIGVALIVSASPGTTQSVRNVRMSVFGTSAYNLELVAYETATLTGVNTYDLTTVYRGILGSFPVDHPQGATFVRMDNASFVYKVPSNFQGTTLYFKFCSYNAYGNQLQSLASVMPQTVMVSGLAPGAVDNISGILQTGTPNNPIITRIDPVITAAHGNYEIGNIPAGYAWLSSSGTPGGSGSPVWTPVITGGGGTGSIVNISVIAENTNYTAMPWDYIIADTTGASLTITLPSAATFPDVEIVITKKSTDSNSVVVAPDGTDTIGFASGSTSFIYQNTTIDLVSDGVSNWIFV